MTPSEFREDVWCPYNWNDWATVWWKNYDDTLSRFHTIPACHGQTDGQTELLYQYRASAAVCWRAIKIDLLWPCFKKFHKWSDNNIIQGLEANRFLTCVSHTAHLLHVDIGWTSVCLSVRPSHASIVSKPLNLSSNCLHCLVVSWF